MARAPLKLRLTIPTFSRYKEDVNKKGTLATLILQNLSRGSNHGYRIAQDIKQTSKGVLDYKEGTLYPALHELEAEGLIASRTAEENGRTRCYYKLTDKGKRVLARQKEAWVRYSGAVGLVLQGA
jgi:PadR family transcriptional regulator PadR